MDIKTNSPDPLLLIMPPDIPSLARTFHSFHGVCWSRETCLNSVEPQKRKEVGEESKIHIYLLTVMRRGP